MKNIIKLFGITTFALALTACGGASGSIESSGDSDNINNSGNNNSANNNDMINGLYKAFTTCENASANEADQTLIYRLCGERDITFENTGNKGVLRITGALLNWDRMNTGFLAGYYDNWKNFYVEVLMEKNEGLGVEYDNSNKYPYHMFLAYMNTLEESNASYVIEEVSTNHYKLTITDKAWVGYVQLQRTIQLDIKQANKPEDDIINGSIKIGADTQVNFTAKGKATQNQPLLQVK